MQLGQQHIQAAQTGLCMLASFKKWVNTLWHACGFWWIKQKLMVVYAILLAILLALNASPANKCQHKFQPGL